jgi:hypothetical protein
VLSLQGLWRLLWRGPSPSIMALVSTTAFEIVETHKFRQRLRLEVTAGAHVEGRLVRVHLADGCVLCYRLCG